MAEQRDELLDILDALEREMRRLGFWENRAPSPSAFASCTPFFADTMAFHEWLQWVFIARFRELIEGGHELPEYCDVAPMAEEALSADPLEAAPVIHLLADFDAYFGSADAGQGR